MTKTLVLAGICGVLVTTAATAQVRVVRHGDDRLAGITAVDVLVQGAGAGDDRCAVDQTSTAELAKDVLSAAGIKATVSATGSSWFYTVVIKVTTAPIPSTPASATAGVCATFVETELTAQVSAIPEADSMRAADAWGSILVGTMALFAKTDLVIAGPEAHDAAVQQAVRANVAAIAVKVRAANP